MSRRLLILGGCMLVLHLLSFGAAMAQPVISVLSIEGNRHVSEQKIRRIVRLQAGDRYSDQGVTEALRRLWATKEFSDVRAEKEVGSAGVALTFVVTELPKVDTVRFEGNKHMDKDDLTEAVSLKEGSFVRPALLRKDRQTIEDMYREKGYYRVAVSYDVADDIDKKTKKKVKALVYRIDEGEKVTVKHIDFFGNRALDSAEIRGVMESKQDTWWRGADFKPKKLEEDEPKILELYRSDGFLDASIVDKELVFSEDGKDLDIFITMNEGKQYKVGGVTFSGNTIFTDAQIRPLITFGRGDVFDDTKFSQIQFALNELYWDRGYIYNTISPEKRVKGDVINVHFDITEGKPAHVHEINISGNTKTSERVVRRELRIHPGDVFVRPRLIRSLREVFNLGFFEGPPEVSTTTANPEGDININLKVTEKQTGQVRLGAGFSALNSISGFLGLQETNFLGKGQQVGLDWEFSRYRQNVDLRFTEPWLMGTPTRLSLNVFNRVQNQVRQQFYDDRRRGASVQVGRPFPWFDYTQMFWLYRWESIELTNFSSGYTGPLLKIDWPQRTSSTAVTLSRVSTDNPFRPTAGTRASITAEYNGGPLLGGDVEFQSYEASFSLFEKLFRNFVLEFKYNTAVLDGYRSPDQVPDYELFRLGGNRRYGVRGYDFYEIVPEGNPDFLGGRFMQILSYEVTVPLAPTVYALAFFDGGNTWNSFRGSDPFDLKKGLGLGIRLELPALGTVGFDYGYGFDKPAGAAWEPHISLGAGF